MCSCDKPISTNSIKDKSVWANQEVVQTEVYFGRSLQDFLNMFVCCVICFHAEDPDIYSIYSYCNL